MTTQVTSILLVVVVVILTAILSLVGIQLFLIFKEIRRSLQKTNKILDDASLISQSVAKPIASFSDFITGLRSGGDLVKFFLKKEKEEEKNNG